MYTSVFWKQVMVTAMFVFISCVNVYAVDLQNLDLTTCVQISMEKDQGLIASEQAIKKAEAVLMKARSAYYPQVRVNSSYVKMDDPINLQDFNMTAGGDLGMGPFTTTFKIERFDITDEEMVVTEAVAELPIFTWKRITNMNRLAKKGVDIAGHKYKGTKDQVLFNVVNAYKSAVLAREARKILLETISEMELFYKTAKKDLKKGARNAPEKDVIQVSYDLDDMKTWLPELNKWESLSIDALKVFMGMEAGTSINIVGNVLDYPEVHKNLDEMVALAMSNRPEIRMLQDAVKSSDLQRKMAKVSNLPMIGAFAKKTWINDDFDPNQDTMSAFGVGARMHLFDGFKGRAEYKEASYQKVQLENQLSYAKKQISLQVKQVLTEVEEFYEQLKIREQARQKAIKQVKVVRQGYQYGITTVEDVNDSQVQKRWSDANWLFKKLEYVKSVAQLNLVVGEEVYTFR